MARARRNASSIPIVGWTANTSVADANCKWPQETTSSAKLNKNYNKMFSSMAIRLYVCPPCIADAIPCVYMYDTMTNSSLVYPLRGVAP